MSVIRVPPGIRAARPEAERTPRERAYFFLVSHLPCSFLENPKTGKMPPRAARMLDALEKVFQSAAAAQKGEVPARPTGEAAVARMRRKT